jgi:hypothetical protein
MIDEGHVNTARVRTLKKKETRPQARMVERAFFVPRRSHMLSLDTFAPEVEEFEPSGQEKNQLTIGSRATRLAVL